MHEENAFFKYLKLALILVIGVFLSLVLSMTGRHVLGTETEVELLVQVTNQAEDSYETQVHIKMPRGVSYINVHKVESVRKDVCQREITRDLWCYDYSGRPYRRNRRNQVKPTKLSETHVVLANPIETTVKQEDLHSTMICRAGSYFMHA
jgi:hypothetical protein